MKLSRLHAHHVQLGAQFSEITGWSVPREYGDVTAEYYAVRQTVGLADLSHRGLIRVTGDDRIKWLQSIASNDLLPLTPGQGLYSSLLTHKGKMLTYFRVFLLPDAVLVEDVGEIGQTTAQTLKRFLLYGTKAKMEPLTEQWGLLLLSGPRAVSVLQSALHVDLTQAAIPSVTPGLFKGQPIYLLRTEETGECDIEIALPADHLQALWDQIATAGQAHGLRPIGTAALDMLRIEAGLPKAGPDINEEIVPPEANLEGKAFSLSKGCYPGQEVVARMDTYGSVRRHLVGLTLSEPIIPPHGAKLFSEDREVGWVSSAAMSPQVGTVIALGFPLRDFTKPDTALRVEVDGRRIAATVHPLPWYRRA